MDRHNNAGGTRHTVVTHTSPIWRLVTVALVAGSIVAFGRYAQEIGRLEDFATVFVIAAAFTVSFWARKRPDQVVRSFGPFGKVANAVRESADDIRDYVYSRPVRVGICIAISWGIIVVLGKYAVVAVVQNLYSWELILSFALLVGALASGGDLIRAAVSAVFSGGGRPDPPTDDSQQANYGRNFRVVGEEDEQRREAQ